MSTVHALRLMPATLPEWRRCGPFMLLAVALHAGLLLLGKPLPQAPENLPPLTVTLTKPPQPLPVAPPKPEPVRQTAAPTPTRERPQSRPTPVLAMTPEQQPLATAPAVVAPPAPVVEAAAKPAASTSSAATASPSISAVRFDAAYLQNPKPNYPALSRRLGEEGKVLLKVRVGSDGRALVVDLEKSSNFERLDNAARQVVQSWRFVPARRGEESIEASVIVPIVFRLDT